MMLEQKLNEYSLSNAYPFHMPGHKRNCAFGNDPYQMDITEIHGFDDLHEPEGLLLEMMEKAQQLYKSRKSFLLVNGSTVGNLAAIFATTQQGDSIIIGRNCHKSVYHGVELRQLRVCYTNPKVSSQGILVGTPLEEYQRAIAECPDARAIVVTSPTYEGVAEPLSEIVQLAHQNHIQVIVDAAHGAHLPFHQDFPASALACGADIVVMSLHKTLPALTQTALLHIHKDSKIEEELVQKYLSMFETSSPSYVLLTSICKCLQFLENSEEAFATYVDKLKEFYKKCEQFQHLSVKTNHQQDIGKILIDTSGANISGYELMERLRKEDEIELEMASFYYGLAMTSVMDTEEGFERLYQALYRIDVQCNGSQSKDFVAKELYRTNEKQLELHEAASKKTEACPWSRAEGQVAGAMISLYPPGVPVLVPGEIISKESMQLLEHAMKQGLKVTGLKSEDSGEKGIPVVVI